MRILAFASLVLLASACSAVDNFDRFKFVNDGGNNDFTRNLPGFGEACTGTCDVGNASRPLQCLTTLNGQSFPGGICTRACTLGMLGSCSDYPDAVCVHIENQDLCLPRCDPSLNRNCRLNYACCDAGHQVTIAGACAPPDTNLCH
jgi:hypothetical protein